MVLDREAPPHSAPPPRGVNRGVPDESRLRTLVKRIGLESACAFHLWKKGSPRQSEWTSNLLIVLQSFIEEESDALLLSVSVMLPTRERLSENLSIRFTKRDLELLVKVSRARGEDPSSFIRRAMRMELARLGFLSEEEMQALGVADEK